MVCVFVIYFFTILFYFFNKGGKSKERGPCKYAENVLNHMFTEKVLLNLIIASKICDYELPMGAPKKDQIDKVKKINLFVNHCGFKKKDGEVDVTATSKQVEIKYLQTQ